MGGEICVHSELNVGTTFEFLLPLSAASEEEKCQEKTKDTRDCQSEEKIKQHHFSVLVVEDYAVNQEIAVEILEDYQCKVDLASNGLEAVKLFGEKDYDMIFMDCLMPVMDGFEATKNIRKLEKNAFDLSGQEKHTPIIALTANAMTADKAKCLAAGMDDYLSKPFEFEQMSNLLAKHGFQNVKTEVTNEEETHLTTLYNPLNMDIIEKLSKKKSSDKPALFARLYPLYLAEAPDMVERMKAHLTQGQFDKVGEIAHSLKSVASNMGAIQLPEICNQVEQLCKTEHPNEETKSAFETLENEFKRVSDSLSKVMDEIETQTGKIK